MWSFLSAPLHAQYFVVATCDKKPKAVKYRAGKQEICFCCVIISSIRSVKGKMQANWLPCIDYYEHNNVSVFEDPVHRLNQNCIIITTTLALAYISVISKQFITWVCIYLRSVLILYGHEGFLETFYRVSGALCQYFRILFLMSSSATNVILT
jgi:hypothetical protein